MVWQFPSKLDGERRETFLALWILVKVTTCFMESLHFFKHRLCLAPQWKINLPQWIYFFFIFEIFSFNPRCKIEWPPGSLDRVFWKSNDVADDCLEANETFFSLRFPSNKLVPRKTRPTISSSTCSDKRAYVTDNNFKEKKR